MKLYILILLLMGLVVRLTRALFAPGHTELKLGQESGPHITPCNMYGFFKVDTIDACDDLHIELTHLEGQPNLYVSKAPNKYPTYNSLTWSSYDWSHDKVIISSWDPEFEVGSYYISVHSYCGEDVSSKHTPARYKLLATLRRHEHHITDDLFNRTESGRLTNRMYHYYRACLPNPCYIMRVKLQNCVDVRACPDSYAWPELLISKSKENVTISDFAWKLAEINKRYIDLNPSNDESVTPGHYYIGVYGWCTPDEHCPQDADCGPCDHVDQHPYNISVIPVSTNNERCREFRSVKASSNTSTTKIGSVSNILILLHAIFLSHFHLTNLS